MNATLDGRHGGSAFVQNFLQHSPIANITLKDLGVATLLMYVRQHLGDGAGGALFDRFSRCTDS